MKYWEERGFIEIIQEHIVTCSLLFAAALMGFSCFFITVPELKQAESLVEQKQILEERLAVLKEFSQQQDYKSQEASLNKKLQEAEALLVRNLDLNKLSQGFYQMAEEQQLKVEFIRLPNDTAVKRHKSLPVKIYPVQIILQGEYDALVSFIRKTESKYILHKLELKGNKDGKVEAELEIHVPCLV